MQQSTSSNSTTLPRPREQSNNSSRFGQVSRISENGSKDDALEDGFVGFVFPYFCSGKQLTSEDLEVIRNEAERVGLPLEILDRLFEEHSDQNHQQNTDTDQATATDHQTDESGGKFEDMEDVDDSDVILAYFSRMASLKEGGHLPKLNTAAIEPFVETASSIVSEDVEVDFDVGYVNKSLDLSYDEAHVQETESWDEAHHDIDTNSNASTTIQGRNRYESRDPDHEKALFGSLLVDDSEASPRRVKFALESDGEEEDIKETKGNKRSKDESKQEEKKENDGDEKKQVKSQSSNGHPEGGSSRRHRQDWSALRRRRNIWHYGYENDLDEWKLKREMAAWKFKSNNDNGVFSRATSCYSGDNNACDDDNCAGLPSGGDPPRISGQGAVQNLFARKRERLQRRKEIRERRHFPEEVLSAPRPWHLAFKERCKSSSGYIGVEQFSLLDSTGTSLPPDPRDLIPWDTRDVRQHFLHERSIAFSRNWFGRLRKKRGNDRVQYHPCHPKSMEMPTEAISCSQSHYQGETDYGGYNKATTTPRKTTVHKESPVNKTASLSFSSGDGALPHNHHHKDDEGDESTRFTQSIYTQSVATPSLNGYSTAFNTDEGTITSHSVLTGATGTISMFGMDDDEISAIVDAEDSEEDDSGSAGLTKSSSYGTKGNKSRGGSATTGNTSRHYSETSCSYAADVESDGGSSNGSCSSGSGSSYVDDDDETWDDIPECGTLINVKPKINERASRLTPDHTSHLLRSRFRKKYFPRGSFPYDK